MKNLSTLLTKDISNQVVLLRSDFNVPLDENGIITDSGRIIAALPTIRALSDAGAKLVIIAHLGRPHGVDISYSLTPVAQLLAKLLDKSVILAKDVVGQDAKQKIKSLSSGGILLLENVRFDLRETSKNESHRQAFALELVNLGDLNPIAFVSDGFGVVHRKQASVYEIAKLLPSYAGILIESELRVLNSLIGQPDRPYAVILGGAKVSDKIGVINSLAPKVDTLIIVGAMAFTFLAAQGYKVGKSKVEIEQIPYANQILNKYADVIHLPVDVILGANFSNDSSPVITEVNNIPKDMMGLDIGPESVKRFTSILENAKTIFWNGPAGVFEFPNFALGTKGLIETIISATKIGAISIIGGGDSAAAVRKFNYDSENFSHISTGGGAALEFLEGKILPGIQVLESND